MIFNIEKLCSSFTDEQIIALMDVLDNHQSAFCDRVVQRFAVIPTREIRVLVGNAKTLYARRPGDPEEIPDRPIDPPPSTDENAPLITDYPEFGQIEVMLDDQKIDPASTH